MIEIHTLIFYILIFCALYVQVFFLVTFIERRKDLVSIKKKKNIVLQNYPTVSVIVPCWNEENTVSRTATSLINLDYPKDKLSIFLMDDGSTDNTWKIIQTLSEQHPGIIRGIHKENGGKHTALNLGIEESESEFIACLDADSFVEPDALTRLVAYFEDPEIMAVAPAAAVYEPKTFVQSAQHVEYHMSIFNKKMLGFLGGMHVTPGTLPVYRREVFSEIGMFRKAYNTEDGEIALRMHANHLKIEYCPEALVYTIAPDSIMKLYRQRLRWMYGFLRNVIDYRRLLLRKEFGNLAFFTLPSALISIMGSMYLFGMVVYNIFNFVVQRIQYYNVVGWNIHTFFRGSFHFDWFFFNTRTIFFVMIMLYLTIILTMVIGRHISEGRTKFSFHIFTFIILYSVIAPIWLMQAVYNIVTSRQSSWR